MNFKNKNSRKNLIINALIEFERMYATHRMLPQNLFEQFWTTEADFCKAIRSIACCLEQALDIEIYEDLLGEPISIAEIKHILQTPLCEVLNLPPHEGLKRWKC